MRRMPSRPIATPASAVRIAGVAFVAPDPALADVVVEHHWVVAWDHRDRDPVVQEVLPDPCVNLAVEPAGVLVHGVTRGRSAHELAGAGSVLGTKFRPGGFSGFVAGDVQALTGRVIGVGELWGAAGAALERELAAATRIEDLVRIVTAFLRARRPAPDPQRALAAEVVTAMRAAPTARVGELAARFAMTPRTLQRLFATHVGATPKQVLLRFRHQEAADALAGEVPSLARAAADLGYFDQAHFVRDFRRATGRAPLQHVRAHGS